MDVTCVVLAAGLSRRFGSNKLLHPGPGGATLLERALRACAAYPVIAVALGEAAAELRERGVRLILNPRPDRGMAYSLRLADAAVESTHALAVLPADLALIDEADVRAVIASLGDFDLAYPVDPDGRPGHPVVFAPRARAGIAALRDGDTIRELRDAPRLRRHVVTRTARGHYVDVDTPADLAALR